MKHLAYICADPGVPVFGAKGCAIHVQEVLRALQQAGIRVTLFARRLGGTPPADLAGLAVHQLPKCEADSGAAREQAALAANPDVLAQVKAAGPFDVVYERYALWSWAGMAYARAQGIPGVLEVNAPLIEEQARHRGLADRPEAEAIAYRVFHTARAVVAVSQAVADYVSGFGVPQARIHVIPNGVDVARFRPVSEQGTARSARFTVGFVGSLKPWHGVLQLASAFALLRRRSPNTVLCIVGDGPERPALERHIQALGIQEAVHFTGKVAPAAVPGLLATMDVAVAPYPNLANCYFSPLKLFEYMAAGVPVVASRIGQIPDLIEDGRTGILTPPGNIPALAAALYSLRCSARLRGTLAQEARRYVVAHHTWAGVVDRILKLAQGAPRPVLTEVEA